MARSNARSSLSSPEACGAAPVSGDGGSRQSRALESSWSRAAKGRLAAGFVLCRRFFFTCGPFLHCRAGSVGSQPLYRVGASRKVDPPPKGPELQDLPATRASALRRFCPSLPPQPRGFFPGRVVWGKEPKLYIRQKKDILWQVQVMRGNGLLTLAQPRVPTLTIR